MTAIVIAVAALILWWRAEPLFSRVVAILETKTQPATKPAPQQPREPPPVDLIQMCMNESETWAREQALKAMWEAYDDAQDWNRVRSSLLANQLLS